MIATLRPPQPLRRATALLAVLPVLALAGCSGDEGESGPSAARVMGVMVAKLVNERKPEETAPAEAPPAPVAEPAALPLPEEEYALEEEGGSCAYEYTGPVTIVPVRSQTALRSAVRGRQSIPIVYSTPDTIIYDDGYVLTAQVESVGEHLAEVGWSENPMRILGASTRSGASAANYAWRDSTTAKPAKKRRRRS